jgi:MOSC domain-containing protein YiiM
MRPRIAQINVSRGGVPKRPVPSARVTVQGLDGDVQRWRHHGGPDRALCLFSLERIHALRVEGHPITPGSIGENLTLEGLDWRAVTPGVHLLLGASVVVRVTSYTKPCFKITGSFRDRDYSRVSDECHPGDSRVYAQVLREGFLTSEDPLHLLTEAEASSRLAVR